MSDRIEGVPEGYRLGDVLNIDRYGSMPLRITFELDAIEPEQPKQRLEDILEAQVDQTVSNLDAVAIDCIFSEKGKAILRAEQQKQLEAVIVVPIREYGLSMISPLDAIVLNGLSGVSAELMRKTFPDRVTIREKGAK